MNQAIPFQVLDVGYTPLADRVEPTARVFVFRDADAWARFWQSSTQVDLNFQPMTAPAVDFTTQMVIGFTTGSCPDGRLQLRIDGIESVASASGKDANGDRWRIHYTEKAFSNGFVNQKPTTPHVFVVTPLAAAEVELAP